MARSFLSGSSASVDGYYCPRTPINSTRSSSASNSSSTSDQHRPVLGELSSDLVQNRPVKDHYSTPPKDGTPASSVGSSPDSLAKELENFHINSPGENDKIAVELRNTVLGNTPQTTSAIRSEKTASARKQARVTFSLTQDTEIETKESEAPAIEQGLRPAAEASIHKDLELKRSVDKHKARQFDCVLSLPYSAGALVDGAQRKQLRRVQSTGDVADTISQNRKVYFGCNLLEKRSRSSSDLTGQHRAISTYTLLATPLDTKVHGGEQFSAAAQTHPVDTGCSAAKAAVMVDTMLTPERPALEYGIGDTSSTSSILLGHGLDADFADRSQSITRSRCSSVSRIEDTIAELDRLEDEFEAINSMVLADHVLSPEKAAVSKSVRTRANPSGMINVSGAKPSGATRTTSVGKTAAANSASKEAGVEAGTGSQSPVGAARKRLSIARPTSLQPPKPPMKSSKPPTVCTFELPGEAVARRLKEQREKRMSAVLTAPAAPVLPNPGLRRARSTKPPTIPTFELPGEAISRRKREEHEAKLRRQEEEEKKRREFKAKPIRSSISVAPSAYPRDTALSRARQNRMSMLGDSGANGTSAIGVPNSSKGKRLSVVSSLSSASASNATSRGRGLSAEPSSGASCTSRAPSSRSTSSISGKRSTVSMDDVHHQKLRGKEVVERDNYLAKDRNQEKREREATAKQARQAAAERSRALSREWAEKQKQKAMKQATTASGAAA